MKVKHEMRWRVEIPAGAPRGEKQVVDIAKDRDFEVAYTKISGSGDPGRVTVQAAVTRSNGSVTHYDVEYRKPVLVSGVNITIIVFKKLHEYGLGFLCDGTVTYLAEV